MIPIPVILLGSALLAGLFAYSLRKVPDLLPDVRAALLTRMSQLAGVAYIWGGRTENGLDCSGAITRVVVDVGLAPKSFLNNTAASLYKLCTSISEKDVKPGDLVFYGSALGPISHVMMCLGDGRVMGATGGGSSKTSKEIAEKQNAMVKIEPLHYRKDVRGFGRLPFGRVT